MLKLIKFILLLAIAILGAAFASINPGDISVNYYFGEFRLPLGLLIFMLIGIGMIIGSIASISFFLRIKKENFDLKRKSRLMNQEVKNLRIMPLKDR